jgi:hypothetical protein
MMASALLERQHRDIEQLIEALEQGSASVRDAVLPQLACDLEAHLAVEEQLLYPSAERRFGAALKTSHAATKRHLRALLDTRGGDPEYAARVAALAAQFAEHVAEQEAALLPELERALRPGESRALAERMLLLHHARVEAASDAAASCRLPIITTRHDRQTTTTG